MAVKLFHHRAKGNRGFSLVELLVVVTIIAILSVVAFITLGSETDKAKDARRLGDINTISNVLQTYQLQNGSYPDSPLTQGTAEGQIPRSLLSDIATDPGRGNHAYLYVTGAGGTSFALVATLEKDGNPANYETHITTNSDNDIAATQNGLGRFYNPATEELEACSDGRILTKGPIGNSDADGNCIPYDPNA